MHLQRGGVGVYAGSRCVPVQPPAEVASSQERRVTVALDVRGGALKGSGVYLRAPNFTFTRLLSTFEGLT